jgi:hypothetical protein
MLWKWTKRAALVAGGATLIGLVLFGHEAFSYARSSAGAVRAAVKDSVPLEFELRRAQDLVNQIVPEMRSNIRLIAQEEVEIASLEQDIAESRERLLDEKHGVARVRNLLDEPQAEFTIAGQRYERSYLVEDLARRVERLREAEAMLDSKQKLLQSRRQSLAAAKQSLAETRSKKALLADRIEMLESQHRLVQTASRGSQLALDDSKIAEAEKLIGDIRKRLDVAERVLAHESRFVETLPIDRIDEQDVLADADAVLGRSTETAAADGAAENEADAEASEESGAVEESAAASGARLELRG